VDELQDTLDAARKVGLSTNGRGANPELTLALKIEGMVKLALCVAYGAKRRTESRGSHSREDFPERNDRDWLVRTLASWPDGADLPLLEYESATEVFEIPPGDRGYGGGKIIPMPPPVAPSEPEESGESGAPGVSEMSVAPSEPGASEASDSAGSRGTPGAQGTLGAPSAKTAAKAPGRAGADAAAKGEK